MVYRLDQLTENGINPITGEAYDPTWILFMFTDDPDGQIVCGSGKGGAYAVRMSRNCRNAELAVGDFIGYCEANGKNAILVMSEAERNAARAQYEGHSYREPRLRGNEPPYLVHCTPMNSWRSIQRDGMLKSWRILKAEKAIAEEKPIGAGLGDPEDFCDYIMFGGGVAGEIVVNSKQQGRIVMDADADYRTGARLYFDAKRMAEDGLLVRDGCHLKVKDRLPLKPYLLWAATWETVGLPSQISTPRAFAELADRQFPMRARG